MKNSNTLCFAITNSRNLSSKIGSSANAAALIDISSTASQKLYTLKITGTAPHGQLILSLPIILDDEVVNLRMFPWSEHIWYYHQKWFEGILFFEKKSFSRIHPGHEMIVLT